MAKKLTAHRAFQLVATGMTGGYSAKEQAEVVEYLKLVGYSLQAREAGEAVEEQAEKASAPVGADHAD